MTRKIVFAVGFFIEVDAEAWESVYGSTGEDAEKEMIADIEGWSTLMIKEPRWEGLARIPGDRAFAKLIK